MKTLYIGIGGNGVKSLAAIKKKMSAYEQFTLAHGVSVNNNDEYLFIDTDINDTKGIQGFDEQRDFVPLNATPAGQYAYEKENASANATRFFEWYDPDKTKLSPNPLDSGAGAIRMDGRIGLYANRTDFMNKVQDKMTALSNVTGDPNLRSLPMCVYVFSGTSGGTGSGILLDVLMTIDKIYTGIVSDPNKTPSVTLFLFGPDQTYTIETDPDVKTKKAMNGAACLYELDAFKRCTIENSHSSHRIFNRFSGWFDRLQLTSPFHFPKYVYYIDNTLIAQGTAQAQIVPYQVMHDLAADFVFNLEVGKQNRYNELVARGDTSGIGKLDSILVNGEQNDLDANDYCKMLNTFAPLSVCFPKELFSRYCSTRFNADCLKALRGNERVNDMTGKKTTFKTAIDGKIAGLVASLETIFDNAKKSRKTVATGIWVDETNHRIKYDNPDVPAFYRAMAPVVGQTKNNIANWIYTHFADMLQQEGVDGVIETVTACDAMLTSSSSSLKKQVVAIPQPGWLQTDAGYFKDVFECIKKLITIEIYDYCSSGTQGVLDHVNENLDALRNAFMAKIREFERNQGDFIGTLNEESSNAMRQYLPKLDTIVNNNQFVEGNEFERTYDRAFTNEYLNTVCETVFGNEQIKKDILDIVQFKDQAKATGVVTEMAKNVGEMFSRKFANDQGIQDYANTKILVKLSQLSGTESDNYTKLLNGHKGALFPTTSAALNAHSHMAMVLADFNNDNTIKGKYCPSQSDNPVDDKFFADRIVRFYITNGFSINDITSLNQTYLPELEKNGRMTHPAFSDKRFDNRPFKKDTIYKAMAGNSVELSRDLLALLMLCLLDVKDGRTGAYTVGDRVDGKVSHGGNTFDYYYQILNDRSIVLAFPTFDDDPTLGIIMEEFRDDRGRTLSERGIGKNYGQGQSVIKETKDCYNYILKGAISENEIKDALVRLKSMLRIRLNDNDVEYKNFSKIFSNDRYKHDFDAMVIEDNISSL